MKKMFFIVVLLTGLLAGQLVMGQTLTITTNPSPAEICAGAGTMVALGANTTGTVHSRSWSDGVSTIGTGASVNVSPTATTTYTVTVAFGTLPPYTILTENVTVTVNPQPTTPTITVGGSFTTICEGESLALTSSAASSYQWQQNGSLISGSNVQTYDASTSGDYKVRITDSNGCNSSWSLATTVNVIPLPVANVTVDDSEVCYPNVVTLTADPVTGASYQWWYSIDGMTDTWSDEPGDTNVIYGTTTGYYGVVVTIGGCTNKSFVP